MRPTICCLALLFTCSPAADAQTLSETPLRLPAKQTRYQLMQFRDDQKFEMTLQSDKNGAVDLAVLDADYKIVARASGPINEIKVAFATKDKTVQWLVKIANLSPHDFKGAFRLKYEPIDNVPIVPSRSDFH